ncbi:MAG: hypothetical protein ACYDAN_12530, partial [Candidatus Limnocylindrales bacterium]
MTWLKVDDRALADRAFNRVSRDARLMHIEALAWSMSYDGTGALDWQSLRRATDAGAIDELAKELVDAGLWEATGDGWQVRFMLGDQMTPEEIARQREYNRAKSERKRRHDRGDHSQCDPSWCRGAREARRVTGSDTGSVRSSFPTPTRPGRERGKATRSAGG